jgi:hypothetical protein
MRCPQGVNDALSSRRYKWTWYLLWIAASSVGQIVALLLIYVLPRSSLRRFWYILAQAIGRTTGTCFITRSGSAIATIALSIIVGSGIAALYGTIQWLVLRRRLVGVGWWIPASIIGFAVKWCFVAIIDELVTGRISIIAAGAIGGAFVGGTQWLILRGRVCRAGWWVLASAASNAIGWAITDTAINMAVPLEIRGAAISGAIDGIVLAWLTQHPIQQTANSEQNIIVQHAS